MATRVRAVIRGRRTKWAILAGWALLLAIFAPLGLKLPELTNDEIVLPSSSETARAHQLVAARFPGGDQKQVLLVYSRLGGLTASDRSAIAADSRRTAQLPLVAGTLQPYATAGLVSRRGDVAVTVISLSSKSIFRVRPTIEELRALPAPGGGLQRHVTGTPALLSDFNSAIKEADTTLLLATGLLVLLLLLGVYRSPILALLPLLVVVVAYSVASGVIYLLAKAGLPVDSTSTSLLLVLMFGAGTDYCLLLVARYRANLRSGKAVTEAVARALPQAAPAMIASSVTVIAAMLAMLAGVLGLNRTLGPVNAVGIAIVLLASLTLLPALLAVTGERALWPGQPNAAEKPGGIWQRLGERVRRRPLTWLVAVVLLLGAGAGGLSVFKLHSSWLQQFKHETDGTRGYDVLKTGFAPGALSPTRVLLVRDEGRVTPADVAAVQERLSANAGIASVSGVQSRSIDGRAAALVLQFRDDPFANRAVRRIDELRTSLEEPPAGLRVLLSEGTARQADYRAAAVRDTKVIAPIVLAVVLLTLIVLLRALVAPLFLLATVVLSYLATLGMSLLVFRYVFGQDVVDPEFALIVFIFLVALGADYNIFLMSRVREEAQTHGTDEGMLRALVATGPVITSAGLILAGTFSVLAVLPIWELIEIGFAVSVGVLVDTFLVRSILVPAIVWKLGERSWWPSTATGGERALVTGSFPIISREAEK
ncbi:MAG TPA: MMPL family transporter [Gaiellaceae bacterium]|nr:MMPL family transporter [Gaiellaceae bacterium]